MLLSVIADVAGVASNIQQFKLFLFQTSKQGTTSSSETAQGGREKLCVGGSFETNQAQLNAPITEQKTILGDLSEPVQEANAFVWDQISTASEHSGYAAVKVSAWGMEGRRKRRTHRPQCGYSQTISLMV